MMHCERLKPLWLFSILITSLTTFNTRRRVKKFFTNGRYFLTLKTQCLSTRLSPMIIITIADVSGKGVPAALFMVAAITNLRNAVATLQNPNDLKIAIENTNSTRFNDTPAC